MNPEDIRWGTVWVSVVLALIAAAVPVTLGALLGRKNANKKLQLDETTVMLSGTNTQMAMYKDLLDRANAAVTKAESLNQEYETRLNELEEQKAEQDWQITTLRNLFQKVVNRSNIQLTKEEQSIFDSTKPTSHVRRARRLMRPT
jgi:oligoendopeptidase F